MFQVYHWTLLCCATLGLYSITTSSHISDWSCGLEPQRYLQRIHFMSWHMSGRVWLSYSRIYLVNFCNARSCDEYKQEESFTGLDLDLWWHDRWVLPGLDQVCCADQAQRNATETELGFSFLKKRKKTLPPCSFVLKNCIICVHFCRPNNKFSMWSNPTVLTISDIIQDVHAVIAKWLCDLRVMWKQSTD